MSKIQKGLIYVLVFAAIADCFLGILSERQSISDWLSLLNYKPSQVMASIASQDGMLPTTKRVFYVNRPQIDSSQLFNKYCPNSSEQEVVLGCYHSGQNGIFILSVNNSTLSGIEQVTAAYETLHAIYQRLNSSEQTKLNGELLNFEQYHLNNPVIEQQIANFKKTEPGDVLNEMTSLFGTEVQNLPRSLNSFYAKYFKNRQVLVSLYESYENAFTSRQDQISQYDQQLANLNSQINSDEQTLKTELASINDLLTNLNVEKSTDLIDLYNQNANIYNQDVDQYNNQVETLKSLINQYNAIVAQRNSIAFEVNQLYQALASPEQHSLIN